MNGRSAKKIRKEALKVSPKITSEIFQVIHVKAQMVTYDEQAVKDGEEFFNPGEYSGGNFDDAFEMGTNDGEILFARRLLAQINALSEEAEKAE